MKRGGRPDGRPPLSGSHNYTRLWGVDIFRFTAIAAVIDGILLFGAVDTDAQFTAWITLWIVPYKADSLLLPGLMEHVDADSGIFVLRVKTDLQSCAVWHNEFTA